MTAATSPHHLPLFHGSLFSGCVSLCLGCSSPFAWQFMGDPQIDRCCTGYPLELVPAFLRAPVVLSLYEVALSDIECAWRDILFRTRVDSGLPRATIQETEVAEAQNSSLAAPFWSPKCDKSISVRTSRLPLRVAHLRSKSVAVRILAQETVRSRRTLERYLSRQWA